MAEKSDTDQITENRRLLDIFKEGWNIFELLEDTNLDTNGTEFQSKVIQAMKDFELATLLVSQIDMFSINEVVDELATDVLQYLLLPYFLGKLMLKRNEPSRADVLRVAEIYFKDFIKRCQDYELTDAPAKIKHSETKSEENPAESADAMQQLINAAKRRDNKIAQYKRKKELQSFINKMKVFVDNGTLDEEIKREFILKYIQKGIIDSLEELDSIQLEKDIVNMRNNSNDKDDARHSDKEHRSHHCNHAPSSSSKPLQPFIITKNAVQKEVFGMGYPSLPVMSVDEFYQQRVEQGIFPNEEQTKQMNLAQALNNIQDPNEKEENEKILIEQQIENEDEKYLEQMRQMDEYKDVVRRGDGNRYNRS